MLMRLQKIISDAGIASRRAAEKLITDGKVCVNGIIVTSLGSKADPQRDLITVNGKTIQSSHKIYLMLNKPEGYVTTMSDPQGRPIVTDLLKDINERVYPVGRLDYDTSGLLIFTNDGEAANRLAHPRYEVLKTYRVKIKGSLTQEELKTLKSENKKLGFAAPHTIRIEESLPKNSWLTISISQGKNRQIRKMCESANHQVIKLIRISYGELKLGGLKEGEYRHLTKEEEKYLKSL